MKEKKDKSTPANVPIVVQDIEDYNHPNIKITVESLDFLIGKIFMHTELLGLTDRQLSAYKSTLRQMCWDWYNGFLPNPHGLSDPSRQGRIYAGLEPTTTSPNNNYQVTYQR